MGRSRLFWRIALPYLALLAVCWAAADTYLPAAVERRYVGQATEDLAARVRETLGGAGGAAGLDPARLDCGQMGREAGLRLTVVGAAGEALCDSREQPVTLGNLAAGPEIAQALGGQVGAARRPVAGGREERLYVAVPLRAAGSGQAAVGAVRTSRSLAALEQALAALHRALFLAALLAAALILAVSALIARRLRRGLAALARGAERLAEEDLSHLVPRDGIRELHAVGEALNRLAERFGERLAAALRQLAEHEAVLAGMVEGVLAVDPALRILSMNPAAARLFGTDPAAARGRSLLEVARNADLERFVALAAGAREPVEAEISVHKQDERRVSLHGNVLYDAAGRALGALIVLNDVTTLRRLENMRRDFVANVSHELKTPITSIQGFVETLVAGKAQTPEEGDRFLRIVQRQAERLGAIIDDLLNLSRIERDTETGEIALQWAELEPVLLAAVQGCEVQARAKEIALELRTAPGLAARVNGPLLEQALVNLIDNAVKYSPEGGRVQVEAGETPEGIALRVQDWGSGIPPQHLPRLFERFYRVDKARSRKLGGTGLGLAIVKHIAQAHGGQARVDSAPGEGSTFTILLPRA